MKTTEKTEGKTKKVRSTRWQDDMDYITIGCLAELGITTYSESLKIARALIRNGVRPC
jgi:hypothetical protein